MTKTDHWLTTLEARHFSELTFQEVSRSLRALSATYVERRDRLREGAALAGAGKRAAFALFYGPLHYLLVREIVLAIPEARGDDPSRHELPDSRTGAFLASRQTSSEVAPPGRRSRDQLGCRRRERVLRRRREYRLHQRRLPNVLEQPGRQLGQPLTEDLPGERRVGEWARRQPWPSARSLADGAVACRTADLDKDVLAVRRVAWRARRSRHRAGRCSGASGRLGRG